MQQEFYRNLRIPDCAAIGSMILSWWAIGEQSNRAFGISYEASIQRLLMFSELPLEADVRASYSLTLATGGSRDFGGESINLFSLIFDEQAPESPLYLLVLLAVPLLSFFWTRRTLHKNNVTSSQAIRQAISMTLGFSAAYALLSFASIVGLSYELDNWLLNNIIASASCGVGALAAALLRTQTKNFEQPETKTTTENAAPQVSDNPSP